MEKFILPNEKELDYESALDCMADVGAQITKYLNLENGEVESVASLSKTAKAKIDLYEKKPSKYAPIPIATNEERTGWFKEFMEEIVFTEDPSLTEKVIKIIEKDGYDTAFAFLEKSDEFLPDLWLQWFNDSVYIKFRNWLEVLPIQIQVKFDGDCDCMICDALMRAGESGEELSLNEVMAAFAAEESMSSLRQKSTNVQKKNKTQTKSARNKKKK